MVIDIKNILNPAVRGSGDGHPMEPRAGEAREGKSAESSMTVPGGDTVALTDGVRRLANLEGSIKDLPVVDANRVEQLREAIDSGSYQVDPTKVADKLLDVEGSF